MTDFENLKVRDMEIKVLGTGCAKCKSLDKLVRDLVEKNNVNATVTKVEDIMEIMKYNVMSTPALVVNEEVKIKGRVPSADEILDLIK